MQAARSLRHQDPQTSVGAAGRVAVGELGDERAKLDDVGPSPALVRALRAKRSNSARHPQPAEQFPLDNIELAGWRSLFVECGERPRRLTQIGLAGIARR